MKKRIAELDIFLPSLIGGGFWVWRACHISKVKVFKERIMVASENWEYLQLWKSSLILFR